MTISKDFVTRTEHTPDTPLKQLVPSGENQKLFLKMLLRERLRSGFQGLDEALSSPEAVDYFNLHGECSSYQEHEKLLIEKGLQRWWHDKFREFRSNTRGAALDALIFKHKGKSTHFYPPFDLLKLEDDPFLAFTAARAGHDASHMVGFSGHVRDLFSSYKLTHSSDASISERHQRQSELFFQNLPQIYLATKYVVDYMLKVVAGEFEFGESKLDEIFKTVKVAVDFRYWLSNPDDNDNRFPHIKIKSTADLWCETDSAALFEILYQMMKNSLGMEKYGDELPELEIAAAEIMIEGNKYIALRMIDNGPGIAYHQVLRDMQKLDGSSRQIKDSWYSLQLTLEEITRFMFLVGLSGEPRSSFHKSGLGLAEVMDILHHFRATIYATNISGADQAHGGTGAKFLLVMPKTGQDRPAIEAMGERIPYELLGEIDQILDQLPENST